MKRIGYPNFGKGESFVEYQIFDGHKCVFSGITDKGTSTVNAAERIVRAITEAEKTDLTFYDLQTSKGYSYYNPGQYSFSELIVAGKKDDPQIISWKLQELPSHVLEVFIDHIGLNPRIFRM